MGIDIVHGFGRAMLYILLFYDTSSFCYLNFSANSDHHDIVK